MLHIQMLPSSNPYTSLIHILSFSDYNLIDFFLTLFIFVFMLLCVTSVSKDLMVQLDKSDNHLPNMQTITQNLQTRFKELDIEQTPAYIK